MAVGVPRARFCQRAYGVRCFCRRRRFAAICRSVAMAQADPLPADCRIRRTGSALMIRSETFLHLLRKACPIVGDAAKRAVATDFQ